MILFTEVRSDVFNELPAVALGAAGDQLDVFGVNANSSGWFWSSFHTLSMLYLCFIHTLSIEDPFFKSSLFETHFPFSIISNSSAIIVQFRQKFQNNIIWHKVICIELWRHMYLIYRCIHM